MKKINFLLILLLHLAFSGCFLIISAAKLVWYEEWTFFKDVLLVSSSLFYLFIHLLILRKCHKFSLFVCLSVVDALQLVFWLLFLIKFHYPHFEPFAVILCCAVIAATRLYHFRLLRR